MQTSSVLGPLGEGLGVHNSGSSEIGLCEHTMSPNSILGPLIIFHAPLRAGAHLASVTPHGSQTLRFNFGPEGTCNKFGPCTPRFINWRVNAIGGNFSFSRGKGGPQFLWQHLRRQVSVSTKKVLTPAEDDPFEWIPPATLCEPSQRI